MNVLAKLPALEDRLRAVLRRRDQLRQLGPHDRAALALTLREAADKLAAFDKVDGTYLPEEYVPGAYYERPSLPIQLRAAADRLEVAS